MDLYLIIAAIIAMYALEFLFGFQLGFHSQYLGKFRSKLFSSKWEKPDGWGYSGSNSEAWCGWSKCILIIGFGAPLYITYVIFQTYEPDNVLLTSILVAMLILYLLIRKSSIARGRKSCNIKIKNLCNKHNLKYPKIEEGN